MDTAHRRMEIISILSVRGHATMRELAWELDVSRRTIMNDVTLTGGSSSDGSSFFDLAKNFLNFPPI
jgi:transcriptional antiterminator